MSNSRPIASSTVYEPVDDDEDDYYYYNQCNNSNSSSNSSYMDASSDRSCFNSSASTIYAPSYRTLTNPQRRPYVGGGRSPREQQLRPNSPKYPSQCQDVTIRYNNTTDPVRYSCTFDSAVDDYEPEHTIQYKESTLITRGRDGTRIKKNSMQSHEIYVRNSNCNY